MKKIFLFLFTIRMITSCATYYIPINSLREQFAEIDSTLLRRIKSKAQVLQNIV